MSWLDVDIVAICETVAELHEKTLASLKLHAGCGGRDPAEWRRRASPKRARCLAGGGLPLRRRRKPQHTPSSWIASMHAPSAHLAPR